MVDRFERFSRGVSELSKYWHKIAADEMEKYGLKGIRMMSIMEKNGLVSKEGVSGGAYKGAFRLTDEGKKAADFVRERACLAVCHAGINVSDEKREIFYEVLDSFSENLKKLSEEGLPN